ncbi:MAG: hypothetical protein H7Z39_21225 [Burkholderiaceae bacterium]|nr:hypothetical protein [Burkholderiaceae bacterium]
MKNRLLSRRSLAALTIAGLLSACAASTPQFDRRFGATVRDAMASQIADPGAAANPDPVAGMDGRSAVLAFDHYQKTFAEPAPQPATLIIGGR